MINSREKHWQVLPKHVTIKINAVDFLPLIFKTKEIIHSKDVLELQISGIMYSESSLNQLILHILPAYSITTSKMTLIKE